MVFVAALLRRAPIDYHGSQNRGYKCRMAGHGMPCPYIPYSVKYLMTFAIRSRHTVQNGLAPLENMMQSSMGR